MVAAYWAPYYLHDRLLSHLDDALDKVRLPEYSKEIGRYSEVGNLVGVSNQCNYIARRFIGTGLEPDEFRAAFGKVTITVDGEKLPVRVIYLGYSDKLMYEDLRGHVFVIEADTGTLPSWDVRCN